MKQSLYYSISPEQTAARFLRQTRRARAACIVLLAGLAALLLLLFGLSLARAISDMAFLLLELLVIACAVCLHTGFRRRTASRFALLQDVLLTDCDPGKYLAAMEALLHDRAFRRARGTLALECAAAHYYLDELDQAGECLERVHFRSPRHPLWLKKYNLLVLCRLKQEDEAGVQQAMALLREKCGRYKPDSPDGRAAAMLLDIMALNLKAPEKRDEKDKRMMKKNLSNTSSRLNKLAWSLTLAEYEALHATSPEELEAARGYLKCTQEGPVPPLLQKKAAEVRSLIDERTPIEE